MRRMTETPRNRIQNPLPPASCLRSLTGIKSGKPLRLGVLSNPLSGGNHKGFQIIHDVLAGYPEIHHLTATTPPEMVAAIDAFSQKKIDILAVNGGDGTVHAILTVLFRRPEPRPVLALLRSGTASMICRDVGLPGSRRQGLNSLLDWVCNGHGNPRLVERPVLKVQAGDNREPLYGMFFGAAGICQGIEFCLTRIHTRGVGGQLAAGITLARFLLAAARGKNDTLFPVSFTIALDDDPPVQRDFSLILVTSLERLFLGLRPYWRTGPQPLYYTALNAHPAHMLHAVPSLLRGRKNRFTLPEYGYETRNIEEAELFFTGRFTLDGELYATDSQSERLIVTEGGTASFLVIKP